MSSTNNWHTKIFILVIAILGVVLLVSLARSPATLAQGETAYIRQVRAFDTDNVGELSPVGLAFSPEANSFLVLEGATPHSSAVSTGTWITPVEDRIGSASIGAAVDEPINIAFDGKFGRFLLIDSANNELIEIKAGPEGTLDPTTLVRHDAGHFVIGNPQGMAVDGASGELFIVDNGGSQLVRVAPGPNGGFDASMVSVVDLKAIGLEKVHGVAIDPVSGHIHVYNPGDQELVELTQDGHIVAVRDMSEFGLRTPQAMVIAPSGDQTDDPAQMSLYVADSGGEQRPGTIIEFSFVKLFEPLQFRSLASPPVGTSTLVQTIDTSLWTSPSTDPSGIVYLPASNHLLVSDSEINEVIPQLPPLPDIPPPYFTGDNLFQSTLTGVLTDTLTTIPWSDEPTGVTLNPNNNHLFFSDDTGPYMIYELDPGPDGLYDTPDDVITSFRTEDFGSIDPEGVTYASALGALFIVDGTNAEIYKVTPGVNGIFDGVAPAGDDVVTSFDLAVLEMVSPEGIAYNPDTNHLYVVGRRPFQKLVEITIDGFVVQEIDISAASPKNSAGLAYGPSSQNANEKHIYIAARGVDNNGDDPYQNDGKVYEMTLPLSPPLALDDIASTNEDEAVIINVEANDREHIPNSANSACSGGSAGCEDNVKVHGTLTDNGDGTITYTPDPGFSGNDSFVYEICNVNALCATATVTITVGPKFPPVANDDNASTAKGEPVTIDVAANDTDPDGNLNPNSANSTCAHVSSVCAGAANGMLTDNGDGTITYTPDAAFSGNDSFVYEICDTGLLCDTATVRIKVIPDTSYVFIPMISRE